MSQVAAQPPGWTMSTGLRRVLVGVSAGSIVFAAVIAGLALLEALVGAPEYVVLVTGVGVFGVLLTGSYFDLAVAIGNRAVIAAGSARTALIRRIVLLGAGRMAVLGVLLTADIIVLHTAIAAFPAVLARLP